MFNRGMVARIISSMISPALVLQAQPSCANFPDEVRAMPHSSRGKSGKVSSKPSGAAQFKRTAKKRSNIRKHK